MSLSLLLIVMNQHLIPLKIPPKYYGLEVKLKSNQKKKKMIINLKISNGKNLDLRLRIFRQISLLNFWEKNSAELGLFFFLSTENCTKCSQRSHRRVCFLFYYFNRGCCRYLRVAITFANFFFFFLKKNAQVVQRKSMKMKIN